MRFIKTGLYLFAEFLFVYAALVGAVILFFWLATGFSFVVGLMTALWAIACVPFAAVSVAVGPRWINGRRHDEWIHGIYQPWRPLAMLGWSANAMGDGKVGVLGNRSSEEVWFEPARGVTAYDVIDRLSRHLDESGIENTHLGSLIVRDGGTKWGADPDPQLPMIKVWADTRNSEFREQVVCGVREFLVNELRLELI